MLRGLKKFVVIALLGSVLLPAFASAQDIGADFVCAAIFPCDLKTGVLLPEWSRPGDCLATYRQECSNYRASLQEKEISACTKKLGRQHMNAATARKLCVARARSRRHS